MLHPPYTLMVLSFVTVGAVLAPRLSWPILAATLAAYFLGLGVGAHFLDQLPGMGSRYVRHWPDTALWAVGLSAVAAGVAIGLIGVVLLREPALVLFVLVQGICALGYPLAPLFGGVFHRQSVFAISWGTLPFLTSYFAQTGTLSFLSVAVGAGFAAVAAVEIRVSRESRTMRRTAGVIITDGSMPQGEEDSPWRHSDLILQVLSVATVLLAFGSLGIRVLLSG